MILNEPEILMSVFILDDQRNNVRVHKKKKSPEVEHLDSSGLFSTPQNIYLSKLL